MSKNQPQVTSEFKKNAVALDADFEELESLGSRVERLEIESDEGFLKAQELLVKFGECGRRVAEGVQKLAVTLDEYRKQAETTAQLVSDRAQLVYERNQKNEAMLGRFKALGEKVRAITVAIGELKRPSSATEAAEAGEFAQRLEEFDGALSSLIEEACALRKDAQTDKMRFIERNADSLSQNLESARRKLGALAKQFGTLSGTNSVMH